MTVTYTACVYYIQHIVPFIVVWLIILWFIVVEMLPSPPINLEGSFTESGELRIHWEAPKTYPGAVISYVIYYSVAGENKYRQVTLLVLLYCSVLVL